MGRERGLCVTVCRDLPSGAQQQDWLCLGRCHGCASGVSHHRERGGSVSSGGARQRGSICGGVAIGGGVGVHVG